MSNPLLSWGKKLVELRKKIKQAEKIIKNNHVIFLLITVSIFGSLFRIWSAQPVFYAHAYGEGEIVSKQASLNVVQDSPIFADNFHESEPGISGLISSQRKTEIKSEELKNEFEGFLESIVGDTPIKDMVSFIAKRDQRTAAFLVGIAKKESSFGVASPSKDGKTCYNYWGYKGSGERGTGMGYACFASAEEAVKIVGDRLQVLVEKNHATPARMVDTWKCGKSCVGDAGAPSWVSTVALYFDKIVNRNS